MAGVANDNHWLAAPVHAEKGGYQGSVFSGLVFFTNGVC
jgi:hypothetical protein